MVEDIPLCLQYNIKMKYNTTCQCHGIPWYWRVILYAPAFLSFYKYWPDDVPVRPKLVTNIWNNEMIERYLCHMEYILYFILILQFIIIFNFKWNKTQVLYSSQLTAHLKTVTWIDITKKAMVPSDISAWKIKIYKTAKYEKIQ